MTEHKDIQNPDDYTDKDYDVFEMKLFSQFTSVEQLEEICMTLAHLPTKRAQELLDEYFAIGVQVVWLANPKRQEVFVYHSPTEVKRFTTSETLLEGDILPGFEVSVVELFGTTKECLKVPILTYPKALI